MSFHSLLLLWQTERAQRLSGSCQSNKWKTVCCLHERVNKIVCTMQRVLVLLHCGHIQQNLGQLDVAFACHGNNL